MKVSTRGAAMLLTADVEARSEAEMLARGAEPLHAPVMLVPHHGSKTSSTEAFIDAVAPDVGILSVGYRNRFHHPNDAVVARYRARGIALRRTDREGALRVVLGGAAGAGYSVGGLQESCRYWSERECR